MLNWSKNLNKHVLLIEKRVSLLNSSMYLITFQMNIIKSNGLV